MLAGPAYAVASSPCSSAGNLISACVASGGTQLDIGGTQTQPGSGNENVGWNPVAPGADVPAPPVRGPNCLPDNEVCVPDYRPAEPAVEDEAVDEIPEVTLADLVTFVPAQPGFAAEPEAASIVGMPTNFVAQAQEQLLGGALFGRPVTVRFTPVAYVFSYGDGSSGRSTTGGTSWTALGQPQFSATPTSHAYGERGTYVASVTVEYAPAVDFGAGWQPVAGIVTATTGGYNVTVYEVRTALVERTCAENPSGPGC